MSQLDNDISSHVINLGTGESVSVKYLILSLYKLRNRILKTCHYNVTYVPIARQRLGKHIPAKHMYATEGCPLLGNGPVNMPP
jgi:hypothetical protein